MEKQITTLISLDIEAKEAIKILKDSGYNISALVRNFIKNEAKKINKNKMNTTIQVIYLGEPVTEIDTQIASTVQLLSNTITKNVTEDYDSEMNERSLIFKFNKEFSNEDLEQLIESIEVEISNVQVYAITQS